MTSTPTGARQNNDLSRTALPRIPAQPIPGKRRRQPEEKLPRYDYQRSVALGLKRTAGGITVTLPGNRTLVPSGWYMLFVTDGRGTPSEDRWVEVPQGRAVRGSGGRSPAPARCSCFAARARPSA